LEIQGVKVFWHVTPSTSADMLMFHVSLAVCLQSRADTSALKIEKAGFSVTLPPISQAKRGLIQIAIFTVSIDTTLVVIPSVISEMKLAVRQPKRPPPPPF
jgi:hypothetical protein